LQNTIRNILILATCQAFHTSVTSMGVAIGGLIGYELASDKSLATLPVSMAVVGVAISTIPSSMLMKRIGRRHGFIIGCLVGLLGALACAYSLMISSFWGLALGTLLVGLFSGAAQLYRFAAADTAHESMRGKAISWVLAGGVVAGFIGPQIAKWTRDLMNPYFIASYYATACLMVLSILFLLFLRIPPPSEDHSQGEERPLAVIIRQPDFMVAALSAMVGYAVMVLIMTGTPLAMVANNLHFNDAAFVIQWHVVAMYLPSFFTGNLITRFGARTIILMGVLLNLGTIITALSGINLFNFWLALVLLGVGWNFMFIGGSTMLTSTYNTCERPKTQALNDFIVFGSVALASLSSGQLLHYLGWNMVLISALPLVLLAGIATVWRGFKERPLVTEKA